MSISRRTFTISALASALAAPPLHAAPDYKIETLADGFYAPWAIGFVTGGILVSERDGDLILLSNGTRRNVKGVPQVVAKGQGGLLDILVPSDFARTKHIFMTYAKRQSHGVGTAVLRAQLDVKAAQLRNVTTIFEMQKGSRGGRHFGSRLVEANDGTLFVTIGDRGDADQAQNLSTHNGSIIRITKSGSVPSNNPFVNKQGHLPEIWSYGHRNPQGLALDQNGKLWAHEHGAKGGDEINQIIKGANYGWPVIAYGKHYSGRKIGIGTQNVGMEQPEHYWNPSIAPSGYMIYSGKLNRKWRGHHFVGSLKFDYIARLTGSNLREVEQIQTKDTQRVRDIREAPDGTIWFLSVGNGTLNRLTPT